MLDLASLIFEEQQSLEVILKKIAATIISFMQVQKCTIFIVDEDCSVSTEDNWLVLQDGDILESTFCFSNPIFALEFTPAPTVYEYLCKTNTRVKCV